LRTTVSNSINPAKEKVRGRPCVEVDNFKDIAVNRKLETANTTNDMIIYIPMCTPWSCQHISVEVVAGEGHVITT
jgi:hypothetical protein